MITNSWAPKNLRNLRSSPKINLVLPEALLVVVFVPSLPLARSGGERSEPERSAGGREGTKTTTNKASGSTKFILGLDPAFLNLSRNQHGRASNLAIAQPVQCLIGLNQRK